MRSLAHSHTADKNCDVTAGFSLVGERALTSKCGGRKTQWRLGPGLLEKEMNDLFPGKSLRDDNGDDCERDLTLGFCDHFSLWFQGTDEYRRNLARFVTFPRVKARC